MQEHWTHIEWVDTEDEGILRDVDTPEQTGVIDDQ